MSEGSLRLGLSADMALYQAGDMAAFERVYGSLGPRLRSFLARLTGEAGLAEDLLQETFLQMHQARHTFDARLPLEPWAFAIARNVYRMDCRRRSRRPRLQALPEQLEPAEGSSEARIVARATLDRALGDLPEGRREALLQHHYLGLSFREIGSRLGTTASAAKLRAGRGLAALRARLRGSKE